MNIQTPDFVGRPIVFLHIPKTAGQTIHHQIGAAVGSASICPIRVKAQAQGGPQMPVGYGFYSGHIDWAEIDNLPPDRFAFSVLRDPLERIASFYFYLRKKSETLTETELNKPQNLGLKMAHERTADSYFCSGGPRWQGFVKDHYDNFYCSYFATRHMAGRGMLRDLDRPAILALALKNAATISRIYHVDDLAELESDMASRYGKTVRLVSNYSNRGHLKVGLRRWPMLVDQLESDRTARNLQAYADMDREFMHRLGLPLA